MLAVLLTSGSGARAEHECGPPEPGVEIVCSASNYDASRDGSIFYGPDEASGDLTIRLSEDLAVHYDREAPGDDVYIPPDEPGNPRHGAVWVSPGVQGTGYAGAIVLTSFADVTSNARGISVGHYGEAGPLRMEILGGSVTTTGSRSWAIHSWRAGVGNTNVIVRDTSVRTAGTGGNAILSAHLGDGSLTIDVRDTLVSTRGLVADGILGLHAGEGGLLDIRAQAVAIATAGTNADGIGGLTEGQGDFRLRVEDLTVATAGAESEGLSAAHRGVGDAHVDARGTTITTDGAQAEGILAQHWGEGALDVDLQDLDITTAGHYAEGVFAGHAGTGGVSIDAHHIAIATGGEGSDAILGGLAGTGDLGVAIQGGTLSTQGVEARGVFGVHQGEGAISLDLLETEIATAGTRADGIAIEHDGEGSLRIIVDDGSVRAAGPHANGIRIGRLNHAGIVEPAAGADDDGHRDRSILVNGPVVGGSGEGTGIFLAGGGSVVVGPRGSLGAASGVAVRAAGHASSLRVDINLDQRRVAAVIGDHVIRNDGGETTVVVNGVLLREGASGITGRAAPNGARNVTIAESEIAAGRVFSLVELHAPRAAVYEALPGFLLGLDAPGLQEAGVAVPDSPAWVRLTGGWESFAPDQASVGAEAAFRRSAVEAGLALPLGEHAAVLVSARRLQGSVDVTSPVGGGGIAVRGSGVAFGFALDRPDTLYARGRFSRAIYTSDLDSSMAGRLATGIDAHVDTLYLDVGRHMALNENVRLTPRAWIWRSDVDADSFTDPTASRISVGEAARVTGGAGVVAGTADAREWQGASLSLRGSLDLVQTLSGRRTTVGVSGETLQSVLPRTRLLLGLGGTFRNDRFSVEASVRAGGLVSGDAEYAGQVGFGWNF